MNNNNENSLWVERYRPFGLEGYVGNEHIIEKVKIYIENNDVPHLLLHGDAGTGKTTLAKIIVNSIDCDYLYINASDERGIDTLREKIRGFAASVGFKTWKVVILDESDYLTRDAQAALRNLMETFSKNTRFILTCNYPEKVIDPIQSRCQTFEIIPPTKKDVAKRLNDILINEGIQFEMPDLAVIVNSGYPDIRRVINAAQRQVINGRLVIDKQSSIESTYSEKIVDILKSGVDTKSKFTQIRQILADSKVRDYTKLYSTLYDRVDEYAGNKVGTTIVNIAEAQYKDSLVVDKEINVMAMFVNILM
jgi:replication factor C small subunit